MPDLEAVTRPNWTTEDAAGAYSKFTDSNLVLAAAELRALAGQGIAEVEVALPAMDAELWYRGLK